MEELLAVLWNWDFLNETKPKSLNFTSFQEARRSLSSCLDVTKAFYFSFTSEWTKQIRCGLFGLSVHHILPNFCAPKVLVYIQSLHRTRWICLHVFCQSAFSFPSAHVHKYKWVYWYRPKSMLFKYWLWVSANSFFYRTTGKFVQKKLFLRISQQSANSLQIPHRLWLWNQMTFPVSLLYSLLRPMSVWHQTEQRWLVFGSDDVYSENGLDFSAAVSKRIICGLSKYGSMTRHMSASILPLNSFMA